MNKAFFASLEGVLNQIAGTPKAIEFFRMFSKTATLANAKRIANHPDRPDVVCDEIAQRAKKTGTSARRGKSGDISED